MTEHPYAKWLRLLADGEKIEFSCNGDYWADVTFGDNMRHFNYNPKMICEFRIKPKPKVKKYKWVVKAYDSEQLYISCSYHADESSFEEFNPGRKAIQRIDSEMIEV